ncbi:hypothetical protein SHAb15599_00191 [Acinetobacter phage SH-Ab 15599]|nr:hypothetical protein SHAb15599_00191 [Acinetobacter phage SH-Ab 15599]
MVTKTQFDDECRELWRSVATAYATDGKFPERMKIWADTAVGEYTSRYSRYVTSDPIVEPKPELREQFRSGTYAYMLERNPNLILIKGTPFCIEFMGNQFKLYVDDQIDYTEREFKLLQKLEYEFYTQTLSVYGNTFTKDDYTEIQSYISAVWMSETDIHLKNPLIKIPHFDAYMKRILNAKIDRRDKVSMEL